LIFNLKTLGQSYMRLAWGQGKIEVIERRQEILDFLARGMTAHQIFQDFKAQGLQAGRTTFYRAIKNLKAEQPSPALPVPASKAQPPKVSKQPDQPSTLPAVQSGTNSPAVKPQGKAHSELEMSGYQRLSFSNEELFGE
jgi:hypothetical protein